MSTGTKWTKIGTALILSSALLCGGIPTAFGAAASQTQRKTVKKKKQPELPPLPSGPTGRPVPPVPLDAIAAVPPQVTYENNQLTIVAPNSTLGDILRAVRKLTGAEIDVPSAPERVVTRLGPGPARDVIADLLNGSRFNYVLLGSPTDNSALTRVVLVAKTGPQEIAPNPAPATPNAAFGGQPNNPPEPEAVPEANEADATDDNNANAPDENADQQPAEADQQQQAVPEQGAPGVKTPQQMLQEMQQRQMQMQQQGQPPVPNPGSGMQPHPPQEN